MGKQEKEAVEEFLAIDLSDIFEEAEVKKGRRGPGNRQKRIHDYIVENSGDCDVDQVAHWLFTEEFGEGPYDQNKKAMYVAKAKIFKKAVLVAIGTNKASINYADHLSHNITKGSDGVLTATPK